MANCRQKVKNSPLNIEILHDYDVFTNQWSFSLSLMLERSCLMNLLTSQSELEGVSLLWDAFGTRWVVGAPSTKAKACPWKGPQGCLELVGVSGVTKNRCNANNKWIEDTRQDYTWSTHLWHIKWHEPPVARISQAILNLWDEILIISLQN